MADSNIGSLPKASQIDDESLLVMEQQGEAMSLTGRQIKDYARHGIEMNFKDDVDAANDAAERAVSAVASVTGMTVEAHESDSATVEKSMNNGRLNLSFGLPKGEKGERGERGEIGPAGPRGATGNGLTILGRYDSEEDLKIYAINPNAGDAYGVGTEIPYDIYIYDGVSGKWVNYGPLSGGGGAIIPENVVTAEGGAELEFSASLGYSPFSVEFSDDEEAPLTAEDILYNDGTLNKALEELFTSVSNGKKLIASAITDKNVPTSQDATFKQMADNIGMIEGGGGIDPSDATATPGDILSGKTAYTSSGKVEGIIPSIISRTITPTTEAQTISPGNYIAGTQTIRGDKNLISANIRRGVSIFDVSGAMDSEFKATLTVTVDIGAVATATHSSGAEVEGLSTNGRVTLELPIDGQWTITARRGVAQYNSVVINVSSSYYATLTAEVHITYYGELTSLSVPRSSIASASVGDYVFFVGGYINTTSTSSERASSDVTTYSSELTRGSASSLDEKRYNMSGASNGKYAIFTGGLYSLYQGYYSYLYISSGYAYDSEKTKTQINQSTARTSHAGTCVGEYAIFGGGSNSSGSVSTVEAFSGELERKIATSLTGGGSVYCASNDNYAVFNVSKNCIAYDKYLTRTVAEAPPGSANASARAGSYVLFFRASEMYAYDLFLTKTSAESALESRTYPSATTLRNHAIFVGGSSYQKSVDVYDGFLTRTNPEGLPVGVYSLSASPVGNYAVFAGGTYRTSDNSTTISRFVYAYQYE